MLAYNVTFCRVNHVTAASEYDPKCVTHVIKKIDWTVAVMQLCLSVMIAKVSGHLG